MNVSADGHLPRLRRLIRTLSIEESAESPDSAQAGSSTPLEEFPLLSPGENAIS